MTAMRVQWRPWTVGERTEAVHLGLDDSIKVIERLGDAEEPHGSDLTHGGWLDLSKRRAMGPGDSTTRAAACGP